MSCTEIPREQIHWEALELVEFSRKYLGMLFIDSSAVTYCGKEQRKIQFTLVYERDAGILGKLNALKVTRYSIGTASLHRSVQFRVF